MKFKLEIELGNDAMQRKVDIETALQSVARKFHEAGKAKLGDEGFIKDENGNTVGKYEVVDARGFRHSNKLVFRDEENYLDTRHVFDSAISLEMD